jgi:hypothetical protein
MKRFVCVVGSLLMSSTCWAQDTSLNLQQSLPPVQEAAASVAAQEQTFLIPAGTRVPLSLASPITSKSARPGFAVRAVTGFPVTVGTQLVMPVGTYVEGVIDKVTKVGSAGPSLQMRFTRMVYADGYTVVVDGANTQAKAIGSPSDFQEGAAYSIKGEDDTVDGSYFSLVGQQPQPPPTLQPLPKPNIGLIAGVSVGVTALAVILGILVGRNHGRGNRILFDTGWQFEMVLNSPVSVDASSVAPAIASPAAR